MLWTGEEFIASLNEKFGDILRTFSFAQKVDLVRLGTCSTGFGHGYQHDVSAGSCNVPNLDLYRHLFEDTSEGSTILVISECCGQYSSAFQEEIKKSLPQFRWIFPHHGDFGEHMTDRDWEKLAGDLVWQEILSTGQPQEEEG